MPNKFGSLENDEDKKDEEQITEKSDNTPSDKSNNLPDEHEKPNDDFWKPSESQPQEETPKEAPGDLASALAYATDLLHHELSVGTGFQGWELDDHEKQVWQSFWSQIMPYIVFKYLGLVMAIVMVGIIEMIKTGQYMRWRKGAAPQ